MLGTQEDRCPRSGRDSGFFKCGNSECEGIVRLFAINSILNLAESEGNVIDRNQSISFLWSGLQAQPDLYFLGTIQYPSAALRDGFLS
jgi:hypothetical protein